MVIFGVTGDLARKKLLPAIYDLANRGLLPAGFTLVGYGRRDWSKADFEDYIKEAVKAGARTPFRDNVWERLAEGMVFVSGNFDDDAAFDQLAATLSELDQTRGTAGNWAFYLSVPPAYFSNVCHQLQRSGMAQVAAQLGVLEGPVRGGREGLAPPQGVLRDIDGGAPPAGVGGAG